MSGRIVWLASFPKSGNTWTRVLLTNYQRNAEHPADINDLESTPIASARYAFDEATGLESSDMTTAEIERLRPAVYERISAQAQETEFMKVHDAWTRGPDGAPLFPPAATQGVIYLLRNPLDVAVSFSHHSGAEIDRIIAGMNDDGQALALSRRGLDDQLQQKTLGWSGHVRSWVEESGLPVHVVRYEDMLADTDAAFAGMLRFAGIEPDAERVARAVRHSSFEELQHQERASGFRERAKKSTAEFFRKGEAGGWRHVLTPEQTQRVVDAHGDVMQRFGYLETT